MVVRSRFSDLRGVIARLMRADILLLAPVLLLAFVLFDLLGLLVTLMAALPQFGAALAEGGRRLPAPGGMRLSPRRTIECALDEAFTVQEDSGRTTACFVVGMDEVEALRDGYGQGAFERAVAGLAERLRGALRDRDLLEDLGGGRFAIALEPTRRLDLESLIQTAGRLRSAAAEPFSIDAMTIYVSVSIGFCAAIRAPARTGASLLDAALAAYEEARRNGPNGIRAFSAEIAKAATDKLALRDRVEAALETGEIVAYFQPQLSTDTGDVAGFEALARWQHPERGILTPGEFLPAILEAGLGERLGEVILGHALSALRAWDRAGLNVPTVGVNLSSVELRNPNVAAKLRWELDRFDLAPARLTIEVLESVVAETDHDVIVRNISALARMGCPIDLDDFGTGHASIAAIRRFAIGRLKIDRSYVTRVDTDLQQQRMVSAILSMAERLGLQTLAEGVETIAEHAHLAQLGCSHVQGFGIARPMPVEATHDWLRAHRAKLAAPPELNRRSG